LREREGEKCKKVDLQVGLKIKITWVQSEQIKQTLTKWLKIKREKGKQSIIFKLGLYRLQKPF